MQNRNVLERTLAAMLRIVSTVKMNNSLLRKCDSVCQRSTASTNRIPVAEVSHKSRGEMSRSFYKECETIECQNRFGNTIQQEVKASEEQRRDGRKGFWERDGPTGFKPCS